MAKYLDEQGLRTLWAKVKEHDTQAKTDVKNELLGGAGTAFDTLKELATALGDDPNFATTITNKVGTVQTNLDTHTEKKDNPHGVTKAQVGLDAVVNTGDSATPVANGTTKFTTGGAYALKTDLEKALDNKINKDNGDSHLSIGNTSVAISHKRYVESNTLNWIGSEIQVNTADIRLIVQGRDNKSSGIIINKDGIYEDGLSYVATARLTNEKNFAKINGKSLVKNDNNTDDFTLLETKDALTTQELEAILV